MTKPALPRLEDSAAAITENLRRVRHVAARLGGRCGRALAGNRAALTLTRRHTLFGAALSLAVPAAARALPAAPSEFSAQMVQAMAADLAARPYAPSPRAGAAAAALDYDGYRQIVFRNERALWSDAPGAFHADFLPAGYLFPDAVELFEVVDGVGRPIPFLPEDYIAPAQVAGALAQAGGHSGLRLQSPINDPAKFDEIAVFQGASYFRSLGRGEGYGISARGVALGVGGRNEEFPAFRRLWIERPAPGADAVVLHALLDGPSLTGAYRFVIRPGQETVFEVDAMLNPRRVIDDAGVAPASSMFLFGQADRAGHDDFRGAVHDSDGLQVVSADGGALWRPLINPRALQTSVFPDVSPRGFGLMQRARGFEDYGDLEARYDRRPSLWVEPLDDWGPGAVHLVEIPTRNEYADNIVAFWRPAEAWRPGQPVRLRYRLHWGAGAPATGPLAQAVRTRVGEAIPAGARQFAIDFQSAAPIDVATVRGEASASAGVAGPVIVTGHPSPGLVRASFRFEPPARGAADIDLRLSGAAGPLSETWRFRWTA